MTSSRPPQGPPTDDERTRLRTPDDDDEPTRLRAPDDDERTRLRALDDDRTRLRRPVSEDATSITSDEEPTRLRDGIVLEDVVLPAGTQVGRYLLLDRIGRGGMGSVYAAYDPELDRKVAVKLLHGAGAGSTGTAARGRLLREAQAMAALTHPSVVTVHDVGVFRKQVFMAMELVKGVTLRAWIKTESHRWRDVLAKFRAAGAGLAAAHKAGLVHRDFKPSNVLLGDDGRVLVLDFGLARRADVANRPQQALGDPAVGSEPPASLSSLDLQLTQTGTIMGSPAYMSPEQHTGADTDARSDQFSYCIALFEALYGVRPFEADDQAGLLDAIAGGLQPVARLGSLPSVARGSSGLARAGGSPHDLFSQHVIGRGLCQYRDEFRDPRRPPTIDEGAEDDYRGTWVQRSELGKQVCSVSSGHQKVQYNDVESTLRQPSLGHVARIGVDNRRFASRKRAANGLAHACVVVDDEHTHP